jgi:hypothetical protein
VDDDDRCLADGYTLMVRVLPTSRILWHDAATGALYKAGAQVWEPPRVAAFDPTRIAGLEVWLDASQLALADGAAVTSWPDLSGAGHPGAIVGTPAPVVRANAVKGQRVVRFKPNEGRVRGNTDLVGALGPYNFTLVYVSRMVGPTVGRIQAGQYPEVNFLIGSHTSGQDCMYAEGWVRNADPWGALPAPWRLYGGAASHNGAAYDVRFYRDGVLSGTAASGGGMGTHYNLSGYSVTGTEETCDCEVAEMVIYDRKLSDAERVQVEDYLRGKWL